MKAIHPQKEIEKITRFLRDIFQKTGINRSVIAWSGGIDSTVSLYLLSKVLPVENISVLHLPYEKSFAKDFLAIKSQLKISDSSFSVIPIKPMVDYIQKELQIDNDLRRGNVMARVRMVTLFDTAKKLPALVCGTENKTEDLLGYFTRFGDQASDIEPIRHLYKTEVYEIAKTLEVPTTFLTRQPSAGLWQNQTDEGEFGFTYKEADEVLFRYFDRSIPIGDIEKEGFANAAKIVELARKNSFKHEVPYSV